jgi:hypothetical protein
MYQMPPQSSDTPKTRLKGIVLIAIGIIGCLYIAYVVLYGGTIFSIVAFFPPALVCHGILALVSPDSFNSLDRTNGGKMKPLAVLTLVVSMAIGFAVRYFLFDDVKRH